MKNKALFISLAAIAILGSGLLGQNAAQTAASANSYDWYFLPQGEGVRPLSTDQTDCWQNHDAYYIGEDEKVIYLTFDCGYDNGYILSMLDVLREENVPAAFFVTGQFLKTSPDAARRMAEEGHLVCNHSMNHPDLSRSDSKKIEEELGSLAKLYREITGSDMPAYVRPPEGKFSDSLLKVTDSLGYTTVFWSFAYMDWDNSKQPDSAAAMEKIRSRTHNGMVALLHSTSRTNCEILSDVIKMWKEMGYSFGTLNDLTGKSAKGIIASKKG